MSDPFEIKIWKGIAERLYDKVAESTVAESTSDLYYILSPYGPCGNCASWWAIDAHGYTADLNQAWKVPLAKAESICANKRGDRAYPVEIIDALSVRHIDTQFLRQVEEQFGPKHDSPIRKEGV